MSGYGATKHLGAGHVTKLPDGSAIFSCDIGYEVYRFKDEETARQHAVNHTLAHCQLDNVIEVYPRCPECGQVLTARNAAEHAHQFTATPA